MEATSYDIVMALLNNRKSEIERVPCVNSVGVSTIDFMKIYDSYWPDAHKDPTKMAKLGSAAHRLCGLDMVSVPFCMTIEAEILGATIDFHDSTIKWPSVKDFPAKDPADLKYPKDISEAGRIPVVLEAIKVLKREFEGEVPVNAYIVPPFTSISSYLVDSITFLKWLKKMPERVHQFLEESLDLFIDIAKLYEEAGADVITLHEMGASTDNISPSHFEEFVKPYLKRIVEQLNTPSILNICGSAMLIIEKMVDIGSSGIALDERTQIKEAREVVNKVKFRLPIIGNIPAYQVIHLGPIERIKEFAKKALVDGVDMLAPGCDFWLETPTEHIRAFVQATKEFGTRS